MLLFIAAALAAPVNPGAGVGLGWSAQQDRHELRQSAGRLTGSVPLVGRLSATGSIGHRVTDRILTERLRIGVANVTYLGEFDRTAWQGHLGLRLWIVRGEGTVAREVDFALSPFIGLGLALADRRHHVSNQALVLRGLGADTEVERRLALGPRADAGVQLALDNGLGLTVSAGVAALPEAHPELGSTWPPMTAEPGRITWQRALSLGLVWFPGGASAGSTGMPPGSPPA